MGINFPPQPFPGAGLQSVGAAPGPQPSNASQGDRVRPASISKTMPPRPLADIARAAGGDGTSSATRAAAKAHENYDKAKSVGVDSTKKSFWNKVFNASVAALAFAAAVALSVATGGAPLIAAAVVAGVLMATAVGDAVCAHLNVRNAQAQARGEPPPYQLPMGNNAMGNLIHRALPGSWSAEDRGKWAGRISLVAKLGLTISAAALTLGASSAVSSFERIGPLVAKCCSAARVVGTLIHDALADDSKRDAAIREARQAAQELRDEVDGNAALAPEEREGLKAEIDAWESQAGEALHAIQRSTTERSVGQGLVETALAAVALTAGVLPGDAKASIVDALSTPQAIGGIAGGAVTVGAPAGWIAAFRDTPQRDDITSLERALGGRA